MIKLIVSDMDGTLIGSNRDISEENVKAIHEAQRNGIKFAIATGRAYADVKTFLDKYGIECECAVLNGGEYMDKDGKTIEGIYINKKRTKEILNTISKYDLAVEIYTDNGYYTTNTKDEILKELMQKGKSLHPNIKTEEDAYNYAITHPHFCSMNYIKNIDDFIGSSVNVGKFVSFGDSIDSINELKKELCKLPGLAISSSLLTNVEVNDINATKGKILVRASEKMGIKRDEVAILGDASNDYSMFEEFPISFAMENAIPEIKKVAKYMTASNIENGVAKAITEILRSNSAE
ncbi:MULTISPECIES: Cof-type HAD-IIB family hydrolase [Clostridium]|uniref:Cof-type HAD-IIB family hydrolase n=1 Tax=Clostridium TaxID=1485 RepID=UPI00082510C1|nr:MULTISPECIES: Cof-type HAD-IIB family hydrolase [Clostridium]PJI08435.1 Cof-type HAD-IIB family hydrolase [Clostridium sp. CT7]